MEPIEFDSVELARAIERLKRKMKRWWDIEVKPDDGLVEIVKKAARLL